MPGFQSGLRRHEWIVDHGACYGTAADSYFNRAADLAEQIYFPLICSTNAWMTICVGLNMIASNEPMLFRLEYVVTVVGPVNPS
jgi:hypothetical protein